MTCPELTTCGTKRISDIRPARSHARKCLTQPGLQANLSLRGRRLHVYGVEAVQKRMSGLFQPELMRAHGFAASSLCNFHPLWSLGKPVGPRRISIGPRTLPQQLVPHAFPEPSCPVWRKRRRIYHFWLQRPRHDSNLTDLFWYLTKPVLSLHSQHMLPFKQGSEKLV